MNTLPGADTQLLSVVLISEMVRQWVGIERCYKLNMVNVCNLNRHVLHCRFACPLSSSYVMSPQKLLFILNCDILHLFLLRLLPSYMLARADLDCAA